MMLKPGKYDTYNVQAVFNSWKRHSRTTLDQSTHHLLNYFQCSVPAGKWKCRHGQPCSNIQRGRENNKKLILETLVRSFGANT